MDRIFPTFCHVSEYGDQGYRALHRMMAVSSPLVLWSPSGVLLDSAHFQGRCRVSTEDLLRCVERGLVQVIGRERWLMDEQFRFGHPWHGAAWRSTFDGALRRICRDDDALPEVQRRVRVVEEEDGPAWADEYIETRPGEAPRIWTLIERGQVPVGSLDKARRLGAARWREAVHVVLRDARNHARAMELSGAEDPFLSRREGAFLQLLERARDVRPGKPRPRPTEEDEDAAPTEEDAAREALVGLLEKLESLRQPVDFSRFLGSREHQDLATYFHRVTVLARKSKLEDLNAFLFEHLRERVAEKRGKRWAEALGIPARPAERAVFAANFTLLVAGVATDPMQLLNILPVALLAVQIGTGISRNLGYIPAYYDGPHWPFLYAFGRRPREKDIRAILALLGMPPKPEGEG